MITKENTRIGNFSYVIMLGARRVARARGARKHYPDGDRAGKAGQVTSSREPAGPGAPFDTSRAHMARVYDFWLGGKDNFAADRVVAEQVAAAYPDVRAAVRAQRAFLARAVHFLVTEAGIRQFLDIGTGLPSANNTHQVAQRAAPDSRVVYVDNDPIVLAHARVLLTSSPEGATAYIDADLRATGTILERAADVLDFGQPVAVMLLGILQGIPDQDDPGAIIARIMDAVAPGSYLAISQIASDVAADEVAEGVQRYNRQAAAPVAARTHAEVCRFFAGLELVEPGVVQVHRWRPGTGNLGSGRNLAIYAGVGRKP
jgi:trans-aconitate methyltransferase